MYRGVDTGSALQRLRKRRGLTQGDVAKAFGTTTKASMSRLEQPGANPQATSIYRYLDAIGATLTDLDKELKRPDALDAEVERARELLEKDPGLRRAYRAVWAEAGYEPPAEGEIQEIIDTLERYKELDARVSKIERQMSAEEEDDR